MNMIQVTKLQHNNSQSDFPDDQSDEEVPVVRSSDISNRFNTIKPIQELQLQQKHLNIRILKPSIIRLL